MKKQVLLIATVLSVFLLVPACSGEADKLTNPDSPQTYGTSQTDSPVDTLIPPPAEPIAPAPVPDPGNPGTVLPVDTLETDPVTPPVGPGLPGVPPEDIDSTLIIPAY
ncbi:MAG: hypothetical protein LBL57_08275 [Tannerella sp.]|jgi:hypothetical protein|nr:hypothetical protein [Tannerella sp.]